MFAKIGNLYLARMEMFSPDWQAFPAMTEETWWQLIAKELKGRPLADLDWEIQPGLVAKPFHHHPGYHFGGPLTTGRISPDWFIQETIRSGDHPESARETAIRVLAEGVQSIAYTHVNPLDVMTLTEGIWMDMAPVFWHLNPGSDAPVFLDMLKNAISRSGLSAELRGGWLSGSTPGQHDLLAANFPGWQSVAASAGPAVHPVDELTACIQSVCSWIDRSEAKESLANGLIVHFEIGSSYLPEMARLRAWRILWGHIMVSFGLPQETPCRIQATLHPDPDLAWETTYIAATTRALSAVIGGVDYLSVIPPALDSSGFAHRIAHNVQHLLKEEGHLNRVMDPLAGSYTLEELTLMMAREAWARI